MSRLYIRRLEGVGCRAAFKQIRRGFLSHSRTVLGLSPFTESLQFEYYSLEADAEGFWWVTLRAKVTWKI